MTIQIVLLISIIILIILLYLFSPKIEGFQDTELDPNFIKSYNIFKTFYNEFCDSWSKAITSAVASTIEQQPLTSPSQVGSSSGSAPQPSINQMNTYIIQLSQQLQQPLPQICTPIPDEITVEILPKLLQIIPQDPQPYQNALNWMNEQMEKSHNDLNNALQGTAPQIEGFETMCEDLTQCLANNPQIAQQLAQQLNQQIDQQKSETKEQLQEELIIRFNKFNESKSLLNALNTNKDLVSKSQNIQEQAQSGDLINQINIPGTKSIPYSIPEGGDTLEKMKNEDPQQYEALKNNYSQWFSIKQLMEQINSNLR